MSDASTLEVFPRGNDGPGGAHRRHGRLSGSKAHPAATHISMVDLNWIDLTPIILSAPRRQPASKLGSRYVVWRNETPSYGLTDIVAYDLTTGTGSWTCASGDADEQAPATFGDWVVWQRSGGGSTSLWAGTWHRHARLHVRFRSLTRCREESFPSTATSSRTRRTPPATSTSTRIA
jgi:hypothetical protein